MQRILTVTIRVPVPYENNVVKHKFPPRLKKATKAFVDTLGQNVGLKAHDVKVEYRYDYNRWGGYLG